MRQDLVRREAAQRVAFERHAGIAQDLADRGHGLLAFIVVPGVDGVLVDEGAHLARDLGRDVYHMDGIARLQQPACGQEVRGGIAEARSIGGKDDLGHGGDLRLWHDRCHTASPAWQMCGTRLST
ncbi:hypothetical protein D3C86_1777240 [compost metagenome]